MIFARFPDGEDVDANNNPIPTCTNCGGTWSASDVYPPAWADSLLEDTLSPSIPGSLTHWTKEMSNGKHILKGTVLDTVLVCDSTITYWKSQYSSDFTRMGHANKTILKQADPLVNFANYDIDGNNLVDYVFITWHTTQMYDEGTSTYKSLPGGVSWLIAVGDTLTLDGKKMVQESGVTVSSTIANLGTYLNPDFHFIRHRWQQLALNIHEYCHDLVYLEGHGHGHYRSVSRYGVMQGNVLPGSLLMEGYLRYEMGWIQPAAILSPTSTPFDTTITLSTSYEDDNGTFAILRTQANTPGSRQYFMLEARQQDVSGETYNTKQPPDPGCCFTTWPVGSGLLVNHITENGRAFGSQGSLPPDTIPLIDIETATGMFQTNGTQDPVAGRDFIDTNWGAGGGTGAANDLFVPAPRIDRTSILAPYTNPSSHLYRNDGTANRELQDVRSGITIYNVAYVSGNDSMRVSIRYDGTSAVSADTVKVDTKWQGLVQMMNDVVVPPGVTLEVDPGATVVAAARRDLNSGGAATNRVELLVKGQAKIAGTGSADTTDVVLTSSRDTGFTHFRGPGETTSPADDDWYGVRFALEGCEQSGYGYMISEEPLSEVKNAKLKYGRYGMSIEDYCAPTIDASTFTSITNDRHVYLKSTDVFIPYGHWAPGSSCANADSVVTTAGEWNLLGDTRVVAANSSTQDASSIGVSGKVDLIAYGKLNTTGAVGDTTNFRPETITSPSSSSAGADWGGITLMPESSGSTMGYADIGYAANPLFVYYPDGTTLENSRVHHFADLGIWVRGTLDGGVVLNECLIDRGSDLFSTLGETGVYLDQADQAHILNSTVKLPALESSSGGTGVHVQFGKTFCQTEPLYEQDVLIEDSVIEGSGNPSAGSDYSGIRMTWVCGSADRDIDVVADSTRSWKFAGMNIVQSSDVQLTCNKVVSNRRGVDVYRDSEPTGTSIRFRENVVKATSQDPTYFAVRTNNNSRTKLGSNVSNLYGRNRITVNAQETDFVVESDTDATKVLNAEDNLWYVTTSGADSLLTASTGITDRITQSPSTAVDITPFYSSESGLTFCGEGEGRTLPGLVSRVEDESSGDSLKNGEKSSLPIRLELGNPFPNPVPRSGTSLILAVPGDRLGRYEFEVFDVQGREVVSNGEEIDAPGWRQWSWSGVESSGNEAVAGIYFLRVTGPGGFTALRKMTVVR